MLFKTPQLMNILITLYVMSVTHVCMAYRSNFLYRCKKHWKYRMCTCTAVFNDKYSFRWPKYMTLHTTLTYMHLCLTGGDDFLSVMTWFFSIVFLCCIVLNVALFLRLSTWEENLKYLIVLFNSFASFFSTRKLICFFNADIKETQNNHYNN